MSDFDRVVRSRRSVRSFTPDAVPESEVRELVDLARHAPSSMNGRPWHFVLVGAADKKRRLAEIKNRYCPPAKRDYPADFLRHAAWIVVVCVETERSNGRDLENGVLAATILLLGAHSRGLGAVFMTAQAAAEPRLAGDIRELLGIPERVSPIALIPLGRPAETPAPRSLPPLDPMIHVDHF